MSAETLQFQTEAQKLLRLMINSLYSSREVFLRELVSNSSDAIDKVRLLSLTEPDLVGDDNDFVIEISFDKNLKELTITDNGIGMTREEVIQNLGTIAKSGTEDFMNSLTGDDQADSNLIGQFGVGFYSAFLVADEVIVETCKAGSDTGVRWVSTGDSDFSVEDWQCGRGTTVRLRMKDDADEFLDPIILQNLILNYSDHIAFPIKMRMPDEDSDKLREEPEVINSAKALWTRSRSDIEEKEYHEFYRNVSHDYRDPYLTFHNRVEGKVDYVSLLFVPKQAPWDLWHNTDALGVRLYSKRVYITDHKKMLLPSYLYWVKGVVDISDLPLNMSRETLMGDSQIETIGNALTKRIMDGLVKEAAKNDEDYLEFWRNFGRYMKASFDWFHGSKESFLKLVRFVSSTTEGDQQNRSLAAYVEDMKEDQDSIYYLVGDSVAALRFSPFLEYYTKQGIEVLLMHDEFDSHTMQSMREYEGKKFKNIALEKLEGDAFEDAPELDEENSGLIAQCKEVLGDEVVDVIPSNRLYDTVACVTKVREFTSRGLRGQNNPMAQFNLTEEKPTLELNLQHPLIGYVKKVQDEKLFANLIRLIFDQARLASGTVEIDAGPYTKRVNDLLIELLN